MKTEFDTMILQRISRNWMQNDSAGDHNWRDLIQVFPEKESAMPVFCKNPHEANNKNDIIYENATISWL